MMHCERKVLVIFSPQKIQSIDGEEGELGCLMENDIDLVVIEENLKDHNLKKMRRVIHAYSYRLDQDELVFSNCSKLYVAGESRLTNIFFRWLQTPNKLTWHKHVT